VRLLRCVWTLLVGVLPVWFVGGQLTGRTAGAFGGGETTLLLLLLLCGGGGGVVVVVAVGTLRER